MTENQLDKFWQTIESTRVSMVTTRDGGVLRSRPMVARPLRDANEIRFLTRLSAHKVDELAANPDVALSFLDPDENIYVSVSGTCALSTEEGLIDELWGPYARAWFPEGREGGDAAVLRVKPVQAEFWDNTTNRVKEVWEIMKAQVTKQEPDLGERQKIDFR